MSIWRRLWSSTLFVVHFCFQSNHLGQEEERLVDVLALFDSHAHSICLVRSYWVVFLDTVGWFASETTFGTHEKPIGVPRKRCPRSKWVVAHFLTPRQVNEVQNRFSNDIGACFFPSRCRRYRFNMQAEECVAAWRLVVHPCLRIVAVVFTHLQQFHAIIVPLHYVLLKTFDNEFLLLKSIIDYLSYSYSDVLLQLQRLIKSQLFLWVQQVVNGVVVDFKVGAPDYINSLADCLTSIDSIYFLKKLFQRHNENTVLQLKRCIVSRLLLIYKGLTVLRHLLIPRRLQAAFIVFQYHWWKWRHNARPLLPRSDWIWSLFHTQPDLLCISRFIRLWNCIIMI